MPYKKLLTKPTNKSPKAVRQINEALYILYMLGIPVDQTQRRLEKMALAFLSVGGMNLTKKWDNLKSNLDGHRLTSREIISYINTQYGENISSGSYDDIRRKDLKYLTTAGIIINSAADPNAAVNNPTRRYAINPEFAKIIKLYAQENWEDSVTKFMAGKETLVSELSAKRRIKKVPITIHDKNYDFSSGIHNEIQKAIIEDFLPRYGYGAEILYIGDTSDKFLYLNEDKLSDLNFFELSHGELPDVIAYSQQKNWLYLIEAVHSANPISSLRHYELKRLTKNCTAGIVYVTAFLDRKSSQKFIADIAWETEVWIADNPEHLIHFNGGRFLGPYL